MPLTRTNHVLDRHSRRATPDSNNSSKPPSLDQTAARKSRAERRAEARAAKRAQGKQPGAPGAYRARRDPDVVVAHRPQCCGGCGRDLADAELVGRVRRQVVDIPAVASVVTDHAAYRCRCACGAETVAGFPPEARSPVCYGPAARALAVYLLDRQHLPLERTAELVGDVLGVDVSVGWLSQVQLQAAGKLAGFIGSLEQRLGGEPVLHAAETGTRVRTTKHLGAHRLWRAVDLDRGASQTGTQSPRGFRRARGLCRHAGSRRLRLLRLSRRGPPRPVRSSLGGTGDYADACGSGGQCAWGGGPLGPFGRERFRIITGFRGMRGWGRRAGSGQGRCWAGRCEPAPVP